MHVRIIGHAMREVKNIEIMDLEKKPSRKLRASGKVWNKLG
jgi:hypothetical protein